MNRYDRSPMDQAVLERDRFQEEVLRLSSALKRHKEALEKARVALVEMEEPLEWFVNDDQLNTEALKRSLPLVVSALSTINDLLDKKGGQR